MDSILNKSKNFFRCVGTLYEKGLKKEPCEVQIWEDGQNTGRKVSAECIKGSISVRAGETGIVTFGIYFASKGLDGKESGQWKMAESMYGLNPEVKGNGESPDMIVVEGMIENRLYNNRTGGVGEVPQFRVRKVSTTIKGSPAMGMTLQLSGCVTKTIPETKMVDGEAEETGRNIMTVYTSNNKGEVFPVPIIIEEDIVDDVADAVSNGDTVDMTINVFAVVSGYTSKKKSISRGKTLVDTSNVSTHYNYVLDELDVIEEPDEKFIEDDNGKQIPVKTYWLDPAVVKKAIKMYEVKKDEFAKNGGNANKGSSGGKSELDDRKAAAKARRESKHVGKAKSDFGGFDDDDTPWDDKPLAEEDEF